ncbi:MAG: S26 family signal peptidase [Phycisphaerales bacterium]
MSNTATPETNVVDTLQSLTIAFALAMSVRSFVTEGFVIPTGSMAPTLLGAHLRWQSPQTGYSYPMDSQPVIDGAMARQAPNWGLIDPMLNTNHGIATASTRDLLTQIRMGDRVLVLKFLYSFQEPQRWDVVVFKNPTDPVGDTQNYIKRLVGLPNEQLLLIDGDVWTAPLGAPLKEFKIQRKPEYVQRAVWRNVHDSDYIPMEPANLAQVTKGQFKYDGPPWKGDGWDTSGRAYRHDSASPATLRWDWHTIAINDFTAYNALCAVPFFFAVSDVRVAAAVEADDPAALSTELQLGARAHLFVWMIKDGKLTMSIRHSESGELVNSSVTAIALPQRGQACDLEFWHVDQRMSAWLNGVEIAHLDYDNWTPEDRVVFSHVGSTLETYRAQPTNSQNVTPPTLGWTFGGSPVTLHRVRVDRDLYYRPEIASATNQLASNGPPIDGLAFGTDMDHPAELKADQFLMLGDNSARSRDGRLWGRPHPIVTEQLGEAAPFIVPRELLLGKAYCVYFPSPLPNPLSGAGSDGRKIIPDFGSLRFIR